MKEAHHILTAVKYGKRSRLTGKKSFGTIFLMKLLMQTKMSVNVHFRMVRRSNFRHPAARESLRQSNLLKTQERLMSLKP